LRSTRRAGTERAGSWRVGRMRQGGRMCLPAVW
jgi:hypothetical protein